MSLAAGVGMYCGKGSDDIMLVIMAAINFLAAFIQAASGFGYGIFAMFLMPLFLPFRQCSVISAAVIVVIALQMTITLRKYISLKKLLLPMTFCLLTSAVGIWFISWADLYLLRKIMGVFLLVLSAYFYYTQKREIKIKRNFTSGLVIGLLAGIGAGLFNIAGPFLALYYYNICEDNLEFKADLECSFLIAGLFSLCCNLFSVGMTRSLGEAIAISGLAVLPAGVLGLRVFKKLERTNLKRIILCVLPLMGVIQLLN